MYWKLALAQHPMYLLIKEDTECAERTPPWGAPDLEAYIDRLRQNLATLRKFPQVKIGYEWSGLELEQLREDAPDVFAEMLDLVNAGQTTFYNGTYSQPHLQTLSSEANYRQFEWGARVYRDLCNHPVKIYAHQESSVNEQTPQILKAFGFRYAVMPHFFSTLAMVDGGAFVYHGRYGTMFMHGEEFASWRGLDGTVLDLYLNEPKHGVQIKQWLAFQEVIGLTHVPPIVVEIPDLIDLDNDWFQQRAKAEFVLFEEALDERYRIFPPNFHARFYTNWSYIEGIRAEELSRKNWKAENLALRAEALNSLAYVLVDRVSESTDSVWKKLLTTQHHDVYCFCAPMLREKAMGWLQEAETEASQLVETAAQAIASQVNTEDMIGQPVVVFNTTPQALQTVVSAVVDVSDPVVIHDGLPLPCEATQLPSGKWQVRFITSSTGFSQPGCNLPGLGYATMQVHAGESKTSKENLTGDFKFKNNFYQATLSPDGTFTSLILLPSGEELLEGGARPGNFLTARDSTDLGHMQIGETHEISGKHWEPSECGQELVWQAIRPPQVIHSPIGTAFSVSGTIGSNVHAALLVHFFHALARIDIEWTFRFDEASIGRFFNDETKLRVQWPLSFQGEIQHDIAFGVVECRPERPFLPASWVDISDSKKGIAYFHQGTPKHWVTRNMLVNLFAWGEDTDVIGNRMDIVRWPKRFDQRLRGTHTIRTALYPHNGDWRTGNVIQAAHSFHNPPLVTLTGRHPGKLPANLNVLTLDHPDFLVTAINVKGDQLNCRFYSVSPQAEQVVVTSKYLNLVKMTALNGDLIDAINPFQIGTLFFSRLNSSYPG